MKRIMVTFLLLMTMASVSFSRSKPQKPKGNEIQLAILLDTSGSMEGLIEQAKSRLWSIVNELSIAQKSGKATELKVALYEYGKSTIPRSEGYLRMILPLTDDLDALSEELFALKTNGGDEYCGQVIKSATTSLRWGNDEDFKLIFIAGNEAFTQGKIRYETACRLAYEEGITVNTIFCGNYYEGINTKWRNGAKLTGGDYVNIDHNQKVIDIDAPQDDEILRLNRKLNETYIAYGSKGRARKERQKKQDSNAKIMGKSVSVQRSISKSSKKYKNYSWDLVDGMEEGNVELEELKDEDLPQEMKGMNKKEKKVYIKKQGDKRSEIQEKIAKLTLERKKYVVKEKAKILKNKKDDSFDSAIIKILHKQGTKQGFEFKK